MDYLLDFENDKCLIKYNNYGEFKKNFIDKFKIELKSFDLDNFKQYSETNCHKFLNFVINDKYEETNGFFLFLIGLMYKNGEYFKQDYTEAIKYYKMAIEKGNREAMFNLATLYYYGRGIKEDSSEAIKYYKMASDNGHILSMYNLGLPYGK
jgi:TPR repeat protein